MIKRQTDNIPTSISQHDMILNALQRGFRTWADIKELTKINDDRLGLTLCELLNLRKIWTAQRNGVRVYGIESKRGPAPQFITQRTRPGDI
jgi:hypothetical protein